jgi:lipid-binding SYLF domain-containing protein
MKERLYRLPMVRLAAAVLLIHVILLPFALPADAEDAALQARHLTERAQQTLETFAAAPEMEAFRHLIKDARGIFIAPQVLKGAFFLGASGGSGVFVSRDRLRDRWAGPAFYTIGGVSFGFQWGGSASEVVLLAMTDRGVNTLMESSFKLGADVGVAVGPVGVGAAASTANLSADILSFSRSKGLYGGISVDGAVVKTRNDLNEAYYRAIATPVDILLKRTVSNPHAGRLLQSASRLGGTRTQMERPRQPEPITTRPDIQEERLTR